MFRSIAAPALAVCISLCATPSFATEGEVQAAYLATLSRPASDALAQEVIAALSLAEKTYGADAPRTADVSTHAARLLNDLGRYDDAAFYAEIALGAYPTDVEALRLNRAYAEIERGRSFVGSDQADTAVALFASAYAVIAPTFGRNSNQTNALRNLIGKAAGADAVKAAEDRAIAEPRPAPTGAGLDVARRVDPIYPFEVGIDPADGWVLLDYRLNADGTVRDVAVLAADPSGDLEISAAMALTQWRFETPVTDPDRHRQIAIAFRPAP